MFVELYHGVGFPDAIRILLEEEYPTAPVIGNENRNEDIEETRLKKINWIRKSYSDNALLLSEWATYRIIKIVAGRGERI